MTINLTEVYDVTLKKEVRNAAKAGFIRPTLGESFMTHRDFTEIFSNKPPVANPDNAVCAINSNILIDLFANDTDPDLDPLTITALGGPVHGTLEDHGDGIVTYTPVTNYFGNDSFGYTITDGKGGVSSSTCSITINEVVYGVSWDESQATGGYTRTGSLAAQPTSQTLAAGLLSIHESMKRCVINDAGEVQYYLYPADSTLKADGITASVLDGSDGQVMVEIPAFYYKYSYAGSTHTWEISAAPTLGFNLHPAFIKNGENVAYRYMGAYEGVGWDASASAYIDCATGMANNWSGTTINTAADKLGSVSGKAPMMDETRAEFRAIAANRGTGWRQQDYDLVSAIQLLYITEYADWNSQSMIGMGRTELSGGSWIKDSYIGVTGKSNSIGNGTFSVSGNTNAAYMTYRGIENFFGNIWQWVDGININNDIPYVSNTDTGFADDTSTNYTALGITLANANGYVKTIEAQPRGFLPASVGGSPDTYITDYYYRGGAGWWGAVLGGGADYGATAGVAYWDVNTASSSDNIRIGGRICF